MVCPANTDFGENGILSSSIPLCSVSATMENPKARAAVTDPNQITGIYVGFASLKGGGQ